MLVACEANYRGKIDGFCKYHDSSEDYIDYYTTMNQYRNRSILPKGIVYHKERNKIFIADMSSNQVIKMDPSSLRPNCETGDFVGKKLDLFGTSAISINSKYIYVGNLGDGVVKVLNFDLKYVDEYKIGFRPERIKVSETLLAVSDSIGLFFYDLKTKALLKSYNYNFTQISLIDSLFFAFDHVSKVIACYDMEASLVDKMDVEHIFDKADPFDAVIVYWKKELFMSSYEKETLFELELNENKKFRDDEDDDDDDDDDDEDE